LLAQQRDVETPAARTRNATQRQRGPNRRDPRSRIDHELGCSPSSGPGGGGCDPIRPGNRRRARRSRRHSVQLPGVWPLPADHLGWMVPGFRSVRSDVRVRGFLWWRRNSEPALWRC